MSNNNDNSLTNTGSYHYAQSQLHGDIIGGDKVYGDVSIGKNVTINKGFLNESSGSLDQFDRLYRSVFLAIERRPDDPHVKKGELHFIAENIFKELLNENTANLGLVGQWLRQLNSLAPDVYLSSVSVLTNPANGLSNETRAEIERIRRECEPAAEMMMPINVYLENELNASQKSSAVSEQMRGELEQLQQAVHEGNVRPVRQLLVDLTSELPGMKLPLRHWLVDSNSIPTAIKVFARNYLDSI